MSRLQRLTCCLCLCAGLPLSIAWAQPLLQLHADFTHPSSSGFVLDASRAYFISADGRHQLSLDAWPVWPNPERGPSLAIHDLDQLPNTLRLRWFSAADDQFWSINLPLPKLKQYVAYSLRAQDPNVSVFDRLIVTVKTGGWASVWLGNQSHEIQLTDEVQARSVRRDWAEFTQRWPALQQGLSRAQWVAAFHQAVPRPYYNLRFKRVYDNDDPAVNSAYEVFTETEQGLRHYCGRTNDQGETREFISFIDEQAFHLIHDETGCGLIRTLTD